MESIFVTARYENDIFEETLGASLKKIQTKCVNVADKKNTSEVKSTGKKYNMGIKILKANNILGPHMIVIFAKNDIVIMDNFLNEKLEHIFSHNPSVGVVGVTGINTINEDVTFYHPSNSPVNGVVYHPDMHVQYSETGYHTNIVAVDDNFIAVRGSLLLDDIVNFDESEDVGFGIEASVKAIKSGYDVVSADILVMVRGGDADIDTSDIISKLKLEYPVTHEDISMDENYIVNVEL